jgi:hypothetical protein
MVGAPMLWNLKNATPDSLTNVGELAAALRQHLHYTPRGLSSVLLQIDQEQSAYVIQAGCPGCALDRCLPGCRVDLLRRVIGTGYPGSLLSSVTRGLLPRPYTRVVIGWPGPNAQVLDASVLQGWKDARLTLQWRSCTRPKPGLYASVVLCVGEGADDPLERLHAVGWQGRSAQSLLRWFGGQPRPAPRLAQALWLHDPHLLTPVAAATQWLMTPPIPPTPTVDAGVGAGYTNASAIVHHLQEVGARVEMLDLDPDAWTATVAATSVVGEDPRPIFQTLQSSASPLHVHDLASGTVALDPGRLRSIEQTPPLLYLGTRRDGRRRWRPLSATHHLVLSGSIEGGMIMGMLAPVIRAHPDLRLGVLDVTTTGTLAIDLLDLPGRLPTTDGRNVTELVGAIGSLEDSRQPVLVVLAADNAGVVETAVVPLLRAAMYRPVSVVIVVPDLDGIPSLLRERCPLIQVQQRVAQWQAPQGEWQWAGPTVLRLPWRDPHLSWPELPRSILAGRGQQVTSLPPLEDFWVVPVELETALGPSQRRQAMTDAAHDAVPHPPLPAPDKETPTPGPDAETPVKARRSRVYPVPAGVVPGTGGTGQEAHVSVTDAVPPLPALPGVASTADALSRTTAVPIKRRAEPLPPFPRPASSSQDVADAPREDGAGKLIVDERLLAMTLLWAEQTDTDNKGVPLTRFHRGVGLPTKAHSVQLRDALRLHGLIRREVREGWYRLLTVEEAVKSGKLPPGPWYIPSSMDSAISDSMVAESADVLWAEDADPQQIPMIDDVDTKVVA